jgi:hypothetical protein
MRKAEHETGLNCRMRNTQITLSTFSMALCNCGSTMGGTADDKRGWLALYGEFGPKLISPVGAVGRLLNVVNWPKIHSSFLNVLTRVAVEGTGSEALRGFDDD